MSSPPSEEQRERARKAVRTRHVAVLVLPHVHLLDLSGPVQALFEANGFGADYRLLYCGVAAEATSAQGLVLGRLEPLPDPRRSEERRVGQRARPRACRVAASE